MSAASLTMLTLRCARRDEPDGERDGGAKRAKHFSEAFTRKSSQLLLVTIYTVHYYIYFSSIFFPLIPHPRAAPAAASECAQITHFSIRPITFLMLSKRATASCKHVWVTERARARREQKRCCKLSIGCSLSVFIVSMMVHCYCSI